MERLVVASGVGPWQIMMEATLTGQGISILLTGGEVPHIGAVVMSVPRPSLTGQGIGCDTWVTPVPGHKEAEVAKVVAEGVCRAVGQVVVVTAGIHIKAARSEDIACLENNCREAARLLTEKILNRKTEV